MKSMEQRQQHPADRKQLLERAFSAPEGCLSVGGLADKLELLTPPFGTPTVLSVAEMEARLTVARLVAHSRQDRRLSVEEFAKRCELQAGEVSLLENAQTPADPRQLFKISRYLGISYDKLLVVVELRILRDEVLEKGARKFAASSRPLAKLTPSDTEALHEFVRLLHD